MMIIHCRLNKYCKAGLLYEHARIYPIKVSEGHLLNKRILNPKQKKRESDKTPPFNLRVLECLLYASVHFEDDRNWDIYWGQQSFQLEGRTDIEVATGFDLLFGLQVQGGTYAKMGANQNFVWDSSLDRWTLPKIDEHTPLFLLGKNGVPIHTDGKAIYVKVGIVGNHSLRSTMKQEIRSTYSYGHVWYG